ncbi:MAG: diguanylate cyclase [Alphaproteobacteria bacterium]|nr:diguanylate cyclase [Alphaproteobacteria bacterium]
MSVFEIDPMWAAVLSLREVLPVVAALLVSLAIKYADSNKNMPKGLLYLVAAFVLEATYHTIYNFTDASTTHVKMMLTIALSSRLIGSACMIIGSTRVLNIKIDKKYVLLILIMSIIASIGFSWYTVYELRSEELLFRTSFLVSSIVYIFSGFAIRRYKSKHKALGSSLSGLLLILLGVYGLGLFTPIGKELFNMWFIPPVLELLLVNTIMLMVTDGVYLRVEMLEKIAKENKERLSLIIQSSPFPIIISRFKDDKILLINRKSGELFNVDSEEHEKYRMVDFFVDPSERTRLLNLVRQYPVVEDFEVLVQQPESDHSFWLLLSARVIDFDDEIALYCAFQDITDRKEKEIELFDQATRDPLTKVFNRRQFEILSANEFSRARRYGSPLCLFMIDADHFKNVNDTYGHNIGDLVLQALADCCRETLRTSDIIARFGGEEFVILLPEVQLEKAWHIADRLRMNISNIRVPNGQGGEVNFTVSIGLVESAPGIDDANVLIKLSDDALYQAKESGRNKVIFIPRSKYSTAVPSNEYKLPQEMAFTGAINIPVLGNLDDDNVNANANANTVEENKKPTEVLIDEEIVSIKQESVPTVPVHSVAPPKIPVSTDKKVTPKVPSKVAPPKAPSKVAPPKLPSKEASVKAAATQQPPIAQVKGEHSEAGIQSEAPVQSKLSEVLPNSTSKAGRPPAAPLPKK